MKKTIIILFATLLSSISAFSQVTPSSGISGSGTTGYVPKFTSSKKVGNSVISQNTYGKVTINDSLLINGVTSYSTDAQALSSRNNLKMYTVYGTTGDATTTSTVAAALNDYTFTPTANKRYRVKGIFHVGCNNTGGLKLQITIPSGASVFLEFNGNANSTSSAWSYGGVVSGSALTGPFCSANTTVGFICIEGEISVSSTATAIGFGFASVTTGQTSTVYQLGSSITFTQIN